MAFNKTNQLSLFDSLGGNTILDTTSNATYKAVTKQLDKAISNRDSKKIYLLSNELGITYNENDPISEMYQEGQKWVEHEKEKEILQEWDKLQYIKKQTKKALDNSRSYNNSQMNDISFFVERNHPNFSIKKRSINNYSNEEIFGMFKKIQGKYEKQHQKLEKTSKEFYQKNEDILKKYVSK